MRQPSALLALITRLRSISEREEECRRVSDPTLVLAVLLDKARRQRRIVILVVAYWKKIGRLRTERS